MDPDIIPLVLLIPSLVAANSYFVATEFALLTLRRSRVDAIGREADRRNGNTPPPTHRIDELSLTAQLGSSAATVLLGYVLARLSVRVLSGPVASAALTDAALAGAIALALAVTAVVHAVLGEEVPKLVGVQRSAVMIRPAIIFPLRALAFVLRPLTWLLSRVVAGSARLLGLAEAGLYPLAHTPDEIRLLVAQGHEQGMVEEDEREMIHGVFEFSDTVAREVMTPRIDIIAVPVDIPLDELIRMVTTEGHSRLPVYEGTIDSVVGVLLAKDLIPLLWRSGGDPLAAFDMRAVMREAYFVPDTKPVDDILAEFRQQSVHLAIVLDEFGGTYGLVTMEDLLEEIVGEINDEYDVAEPEFSPTPEGDVLIDGGAAISEVNERFELRLPEEDYDTIGGYIFGALGRVPVSGDVVGDLDGDADLSLVVEEIEDRRILRVRLTRVPVASEAITEE